MRKRTSFFKNYFLLLSIFLALSWALSASAYTIEKLPDVAVEKDFTVGPAQNEVFLDPGAEATKNLMVTSRLGKTTSFIITLEDFKGTTTGETSALLLGGERNGPYSLIDYLKPETTEFTLNHGERIALPIKISIPADAEPGGRYGAVLVSITNPVEIKSQEGEVVGGINVTGRVAALYLVRVRGDVEEDGFLREIRTVGPKKWFYDKGPISLELLFENRGSVHLNLYGVIEIRNLFNKKVGEIKLDPWFAMPQSLRSRVVKFDRSLLFGRYTALASINRGYDDIVDQKSVNFWVIPWKFLAAGIIILGLFAFLLRWLLSKVEIRVKR
ncbi:MAG: hypothetical protein Q8N16_02965 [bacterium]|nr:hypothetical protein [bacterium]